MLEEGINVKRAEIDGEGINISGVAVGDTKNMTEAFHTVEMRNL